MKVLVAGIGITGKSSLRRKLVSLLTKSGLRVLHYDADDFQEIRSEADVDCEKPEGFLSGIVYLIEDVRGTVEERSAFPLSSYDLILYLKPNIFVYCLFWVSRMWQWFKGGRFSWDRMTGWKGTGKSYDWRNVLPVFKEAFRDLKNRKKWVREDMLAVKNCLHIIIKPKGSFQGPWFPSSCLNFVVRVIKEIQAT